MKLTPVIAASAIVASFLCALPAAAQNLRDSYCTRISQNDKFASDGFHLTDAASILRQDRANWHRFGNADAEDQGDNTFSSVSARARIPALLTNGSSNQSTYNRIVNGNPYVCVEIYSNYMYVYEN